MRIKDDMQRHIMAIQIITRSPLSQPEFLLF
jgi:hypothetical protein